MGATATISADFKIDVPEDLRGKDGWKPGQEIILVPAGGDATETSANAFDTLRGIAKGANPNGYRDRNDRY